MSKLKEILALKDELIRLSGLGLSKDVLDNMRIIENKLDELEGFNVVGFKKTLELANELKKEILNLKHDGILSLDVIVKSLNDIYVVKSKSIIYGGIPKRIR